jgi:hypothetical protein
MKQSAREKKLDAPMPMSKYEGPDYPYELRVTLDQDALKKLGMKAGGFKLGDKIEILASGEVMSTSENKHANRSGEHINERVEIQLKRIHVCEPGHSIFDGNYGRKKK